MAGALDLRLNGPRVYGETLVDDHWMGDGRAEAAPHDVRDALRLFRMVCFLQFCAVVGLVVLLHG